MQRCLEWFKALKTDFTHLEEELAGGRTRPFYLLYGDEGYLIEKAVGEILATLLPPQFRELNFKSCYAEEAPSQEVIGACNTLPFLAQRRVVLVKDANKYSQHELEAFFPYLKSPSPTTSLIFIAEGMATGFLNLREVKEGLFHLRRPPQGEIPHWIRKIARELGKEISPEASEYLQEVIGRDLQGIQNELSKVSLYVGDKGRIELGDVEGVVSELKVTSIFELTKAIGERDTKRALLSLGKIWESGEHHLKILGMIARQFRHLLMTKEVLAEGAGEKEIRKRLGVSNPYYLRELSVQARSFSTENLQSTLLNLWETDMNLKRSSLSRRLLLEGLVIRLCKPS
ncbi:MAG: DNA polymerase III subunit delta [Deltaproteobacteria bacterium]|nr:DNA polymerase III subunit delta [Deltaproteobacteria bacterium]